MVSTEIRFRVKIPAKPNNIVEVQMKKIARRIMIPVVVAIFSIAALSLSGCGGGYHHMTEHYGRGYSGNISNNADYYGSNDGNSRYRGYGSMTGNGPGFNDYCLP
jgi:hypothetical protein